MERTKRQILTNVQQRALDKKAEETRVNHPGFLLAEHCVDAMAELGAVDWPLMYGYDCRIGGEDYENVAFKHFFYYFPESSIIVVHTLAIPTGQPMDPVKIFAMDWSISAMGPRSTPEQRKKAASPPDRERTRQFISCRFSAIQRLVHLCCLTGAKEYVTTTHKEGDDLGHKIRGTLTEMVNSPDFPTFRMADGTAGTAEVPLLRPHEDYDDIVREIAEGQLKDDGLLEEFRSSLKENSHD